MRCLVLGHNGLIGSHLIEELNNRGHKVFIYTCKIDKNFKINEKVDWVFQLAGNVGGIKYIADNGSQVIKDNLLLDTVVLDESIKTGVKKIFYPSSACIYPTHLQGYNYRVLAEEDDHPINPDNIYGLEKIFMEKYYLEFKDKIDIKIGRMFSVFGEADIKSSVELNAVNRRRSVKYPWKEPGGYNLSKEKFISAISRKIINADKEIEIFGTGEEVRDSIYVKDAVSAIVFYMESDTNNNVINISDRPISVKYVVDFLVKYSGKDLIIKNKMDVETGVKNRYADISRLNRMGFKPYYGIDEGLRRNYDWVVKKIKGEQ